MSIIMSFEGAMHFLITPPTALIYLYISPRTTQVYIIYIIVLLGPCGSHECSKRETRTIILSVAVIHSWRKKTYCTPTTTGREICQQHETIHNNVLFLRIRLGIFQYGQSL